MPVSETSTARRAQKARIVGPIVAIAVWFVLPGDVGTLARATAAVAVLMAVYWMTEALPVAITSMLPLVLFPLLGIQSISETAAPYASPIIFLFVGGFMLALAVEKSGLHRRLALRVIDAVGTRSDRLVGGFMAATAFLSMWISNTATTLMMIPIAMSVVDLLRKSLKHDHRNTSQLERFEVCLLLSIAYSASIGGVGTLVGTPPNALLAGFLEQKGIGVGFGKWMLLALPIVFILLVSAWLLLTRVIYRCNVGDASGIGSLVRKELDQLGAPTRAEWTVVSVFGATVCLWVIREPLTNWIWIVNQLPAVAHLSDATIALAAAITLYIVPVGDGKPAQLDSDSVNQLPWNVMLLLGGGLTLASGVQSSGLDTWFGTILISCGNLPMFVLVLTVTATVLILTEITSNTATSATLIPILFGVTCQFELAPLTLVAPATIAASCAFMLPVATPPNAIVAGTGRVRPNQMIRTGVWLNAISAVFIAVGTHLITSRLFSSF